MDRPSKFAQISSSGSLRFFFGRLSLPAMDLVMVFLALMWLVYILSQALK